MSLRNQYITFKFFIFLLYFFICGNAKTDWVEQNSGTTSEIVSISAVNNNTAWASTYGTQVIRTTNGGSTWLAAQPVPGLQFFTSYNIFAMNENTAFVSGGSLFGTAIFKTTNGGTNWKQVYFLDNGFADQAHVYALVMTSENNGFFYGRPLNGFWSLYRTTNGGENWSSSGLFLPQNGSEEGMDNQLNIIDNNIWFSSTANRIYHSSNNGANWTAVNSYPGGPMNFLNSSTGIAGLFSLYITTNGGVNWTLNTSTGIASGNIKAVTGYENNFWFTRSNFIYRTTDGGSSWTTDYTSASGSYNCFGKARNGKRIWAGKTNGGISKTDFLVGIESIASDVPNNFKLNQNYPNPFNPSTTIGYELPFDSKVTLKILNITGREVSSIIIPLQPAGNHTIQFDANELPSGIYFYSIITEAKNNIEYSATKKMILLK